MAMPCSVRDRELQKFQETADGKTSVRVSGTGSILAGLSYDRIDASYPDAITEVYVYSLSAVTQATITVVYTDATKEFIDNVVRS